MTTNPRSREAAYADLVTGLVDARVDVASDRFDAELEAAEASGRLDPATARLLRWWQRESVRAVTEHTRTMIPPTLVALERAAVEAREAVQRADAAWTTARGVTSRSTYAQPDTADGAGSSGSAWPPPAASAAAVTPAPETDVAPSEPNATSEPPAPAPVATVVPEPAPAPYAPPTLEPPGYPSAPLGSAATSAPPADPPSTYAPTTYAPTTDAPATERVTSVPPVALPTEQAYAGVGDEVPAVVDLTDPPAEPSSTTTPPSGRRRTLLAGLTVLPRSD